MTDSTAESPGQRAEDWRYLVLYVLYMLPLLASYLFARAAVENVTDAWWVGAIASGGTVLALVGLHNWVVDGGSS